MTILESKEIPVEDPIAAIELFMENGWTDGLPIVPPTPDGVRRMVGDRDPQEFIGYVPPMNGGATVEKLAINALMAGCKPEYLPVVIAGFKAMLTEKFNLKGVQSTTHMSTPGFVVNGPIARKLEINSKAGCLGSGFRANAAIGRALRLIMMNLGGGIPGETDKATFGHPGKYAYLFAENEEESPWEPFHTGRGFKAEESTITAFSCEPPHNINNHAESDPFLILYGVAGAMKGTGHNNFYVMGDTMVVLCPEHAASIAESGWKKRDVQYYLWETARQPLKELKYNGMYGSEYKKNFWPRWVDRENEESLAPIVRTPEDILVFVAGGHGRHSVFIPGWGTRAITEKIEV
ncbi:MAG: hypothetical protein CMH76_12100 [Nitrospinae bacterium]|nr:hypothetical protein [Nitrospinota bacterium]